MTASPISQLRTFVNKHTAWPTSSPNSKKEKVWEAVKFIFKCLLVLCLLALNPTLFIAGLIIGAVAPNKVSKVVENMFAVAKQWPIYSALFIGAAACVALPALSGTTSLLFAAYMSSELIKKCKNGSNNVVNVVNNPDNVAGNNASDYVINVNEGANGANGTTNVTVTVVNEIAS